MRKSTSTYYIAILGFYLTVILPGCGTTSADGFTGERGQVKGKITVDGEPLAANCQVLFLANKGGYSASGLIKEGGGYTLVYTKGKGLPVGDYLVQLTLPIAAAEAKVEVQSDPAKMGAMMNITKETAKSPTELDSGRPFPLRYESTRTSKLIATVISGQNEIDFDLEKKEKSKK